MNRPMRGHPKVVLTPAQRALFKRIREHGEDAIKSERDRTTIANVIRKCNNAGGGLLPLLDALGLDILTISLSLMDCMKKATRPGRGAKGQSVEVADYNTRHAATRTALELRRELGPGRPKAPPPSGPGRPRGKSAPAGDVLGPASEPKTEGCDPSSSATGSPDATGSETE